MKSPWVQDLTLFFENLGRPSLRPSVKNKRESDISILNSKNEDSCYKHEKEISLFDNNVNDSHRKISYVDRCFKVKEAKAIFERMNEKYKIQKPETQRCDDRRRRVSANTRPYCSSTEGVGVGVDTTGVRPCSKSPFTTINKTSTKDEDHSPTKFHHERKNTVTKSPSLVDSKSSEKYKSSITVADIERENDGVVVRIKNQEKYYDGRTKYKSLLPEPPYHKVRTRLSILTQKSIDRPDNYGDVIEEVVDYDCDLEDSSKLEDNPNLVECNDSEDLEPCSGHACSSEVKLSDLIWLGPQRIKWVETYEGQTLIRNKDLNPDVIKWQEAQFEVITSEATYYHSLEILVNRIYKSPLMVCHGEHKQQLLTDNDITGDKDYPLFKPLMTALQKHHLFSNILEIHICSGDLLKSLEMRWRETPFIEDLSDIIVAFCKDRLRPYITYLRNQSYQTATYNQLLTKPEFADVINILENDRDCGKMNLSSFLLLPMQRLLRLKLLFTVIRHYIPPGFSTQGCAAALISLETLIKECSDQKMLMEQKEEILKIYSRLTFRQQTGVSISNKPLLRSDELKIYPGNSKASTLLSSGFVMRTNNKAILYLFEDQLIIAKTRRLPLCLSSNENREIVADICPRSEVTFESCASTKSLFSTKNYSFKLTLAKGLRGCAQYLCEADSKANLVEWQNIFCPETGDVGHFEFNDVLVSRDYKSMSSKELDLTRGQILTITKRISDGRAVATSGDKQGEIPLSHVQYVIGSPPNMDLMKAIGDSIRQSRQH